MTVGSQPPEFGHIPVSNQFARRKAQQPTPRQTPRSESTAAKTCTTLSTSLILLFLAREINDSENGVQQLLDWAVVHWNIELVAGKDKIVVDDWIY